MFPLGHAAFAYFVHRWVTNRRASAFAYLALTAGALVPAAAGEALQRWPVFGLSHLWSHSPLTLAGIWLVYGIVAAPFRGTALASWLLAFALGYSTHLLSDPFFDMLHLYFSVRTDDVGQSWLFPFARVNIREPRLDPGYYLVYWQLAVEAMAFIAALVHWQRSGDGSPSESPGLLVERADKSTL